MAKRTQGSKRKIVPCLLLHPEKSSRTVSRSTGCEPQRALIRDSFTRTNAIKMFEIVATPSPRHKTEVQAHRFSQLFQEAYGAGRVVEDEDGLDALHFGVSQSHE